MPEVLQVADDCVIPVEEIDWRVDTSGGPGGQHANRARTRVEARFDIAHSPSLTAKQRTRLRSQLGPIVRVAAADARSQTRNRAIALDRLRDRLAEALREEEPRRPTRPSSAARRRRLDDKRRRSHLKRARRQPPDES